MARGNLVGLDAVIDKDRCSAELAVALGADLLVLLTGVPRVALDFGTPTAREALRLTVSDALRHLDAGEFPAGSMGPKIEGAARFVDHGGRAVITAAGTSPPPCAARTAPGSSPTPTGPRCWRPPRGGVTARHCSPVASLEPRRGSSR